MSPVIHIVGWALIHFVWQAGALGVAAAAAMRLCRRPNSRYVVACLGLAGMLAAPIATLAFLTSSFPRNPTASVTVSLNQRRRWRPTRSRHGGPGRRYRVSGARRRTHLRRDGSRTGRRPR